MVIYWRDKGWLKIHIASTAHEILSVSTINTSIKLNNTSSLYYNIKYHQYTECKAWYTCIHDKNIGKIFIPKLKRNSVSNHSTQLNQSLSLYLHIYDNVRTELTHKMKYRIDLKQKICCQTYFTRCDDYRQFWAFQSMRSNIKSTKRHLLIKLPNKSNQQC